MDDRVNEESIIWHTGLDGVIEVNIEVGTVCTGTLWSLADRLASIADLWTKCKGVDPGKDVPPMRWKSVSSFRPCVLWDFGEKDVSEKRRKTARLRS